MTRRRRPRRSGALTELPPLRILRQMAVLQACFYGAAAPLMLFTALVSGRPFSLDLILGWEPVRGDTTQGWLVAFVWLLAGGLLCTSVALVLVVRRSKLVLDFALSLHAIHLVVVTVYAGGALPAHLAWWLTMALSSALAIALGTWGCRYRELRPISFGGGGGAGAGGASGSGAAGASQTTQPNDGPTAHPDEEQGFVPRGSRRGRGRDGAGEYEMVAVKPKEGSGSTA